MICSFVREWVGREGVKTGLPAMMVAADSDLG